MAAGEQGAGLGTLIGQVKEKTSDLVDQGKEALSNLNASPSPTTEAPVKAEIVDASVVEPEIVDAEVVDAEANKPGGFLSNFLSNQQASTQKEAEAATKSSETSATPSEEMKPNPAEAEVPWTQSENAEKIGKLLLGKLNPFGPKSK